jgi:ATP-dependent helicase/nuclease subunit B
VRPERGYNAGMGANQTPEIDAWLRDGGVVVTASDRAARAISSAYHRRRLAEGRKAWTAPAVVDWQRFAREEWERRSTDARLVLNPIQERAIWVEIVAAGGHAAATLPESRHRLAAMAMEAHSLLGSYAPRLLDRRARAGWANDAAAFSHWLTSFDDSCDADNAMSASRVALELIPLLERDPGPRPPLLLAGFDRLLPVQHAFFEAWGDWRLVSGSARARASFYAAPDAESELAACALACNARLAKQPDMRLLVVTQDAATRRGEIERAFLQQRGEASPAPFEFSLGVPLGGVAIARSAMLLLRWLAGAIEEHHLDWLFGTRYSTKTAEEASALQAFMRDLRRHGLQRTHWTLEAFLQQRANPALPASWMERMNAAQRRMRAARQKNRGPLEWAELAPLMLSDIGWPGPTLGFSAEFQAAQRLQQVIEQCSSLGFDGRLIEWNDFLADLARALAETLFSPESLDSPILIAGPAESAGLTADAIWFLGASEDGWPTRGGLHPLIPAPVQRQALMPHASPQLDWELADAITRRLLASAPGICFSYAQQVEGVDGRPSRIVTQLAGSPEPLPLNLVRRPAAPPLTVCVDDQSVIPLLDPDTDKSSDSPLKIRGGSKVLTAQSQCAFKGFAVGRLGAETWDPAEAGLSPSVRGQLLHAVMHAIWAGPPLGIHSLDQLQRIPDRRAFVGGHVNTALRHELPDSARELMPHRYLELEVQRLTRIVAEWLDYEVTRLPFTVMGTELNTETTVGHLSFGLRLDRIDRLKDGSLLVIDYKTGDVSQKSWDLPRPDDVQLPLYGGFALESGRKLGGLVFARIRAGDVCFAGRVRDIEGTLGSGLTNFSSLRKNQLEVEHLLDWRDAIEQLARDYVAGRADVNPRDPPKTCSRCGLHTLCRIHERPVDAQEEDAGDADE